MSRDAQAAEDRVSVRGIQRKPSCQSEHKERLPRCIAGTGISSYHSQGLLDVHTHIHMQADFLMGCVCLCYMVFVGRKLKLLDLFGRPVAFMKGRHTVRLLCVQYCSVSPFMNFRCIRISYNQSPRLNWFVLFFSSLHSIKCACCAISSYWDDIVTVCCQCTSLKVRLSVCTRPSSTERV